MRRLSILLSSLALGALSCHVPGLPPVDAAPPTARVREEAKPPLPGAGGAARYLARRASGLTAAEIEVVAEEIARASRSHGLDPQLVMAVIHVESRGNNFALSPVGAMGLMQIMPATGEELAGTLAIRWRGPATLFDPIVNVRLGVAYLRQLADRYDDLPTALAAYNWGPGRIDRKLRRGAPLPVSYANLVLDAYPAGRSRQPSS